MKIEILMSKLFGFSPGTYFNWKKEEEKRPIIKFLNNYFDKKELIEFISTGKIDKFDNLVKIQSLVINNSAHIYINTFLQKTDSNTLKNASPFFLDFYFTFLAEFKKSENNQKFSNSINSFFIEYVLKNKDESRLKEISRYMFLFNDWDDLMSIFLNLSLPNNLSILLAEIDDAYNNKIKKEEIYFHIISLYVYRKHSSLNSLLKIELIKNLHDVIRNEFYTYDLLMQEIQKIEFDRIEALKEIGFNKPLY